MPQSAQLKQELEGLMASFLLEKTEQAAARSARMRPVLEGASAYVQGDGKRLRPQLLCWGYWGAGGTDEAIKKASLSVELIHSYLLIHDDIIDRDELRRGKPTVHVSYRTLAGPTPDAHLGESMAIIAGDILSGYGYELLTDSAFPAENRLRAVARLNRLIDEVTLGESLDILSSYVGDSMTEQDILDISHYKTAAYTVDGPLQIGGMLAGASDSLLAAYTAYAIPLGMAFQLRDDVLGVFGDSRETGKSVSSDLTEGKRTLLAYKALEKASPQDSAILRAGLGNSELSEAECENLRGIIRNSGALEEVEGVIRRLHAESLAALAQAEITEDIRHILTETANYIINRTR